MRRLTLPLAIPLNAPDASRADTHIAESLSRACSTHCRHMEVPLGCAAATVLIEWHFAADQSSAKSSARLSEVAPCLLWPNSALPGVTATVWDPADGGHADLLERIAVAHGAAFAAEADLLLTTSTARTVNPGTTPALELMVMVPKTNRALRVGKGRQGRSVIFAVLPEDRHEPAASPVADWVASSHATGDEEVVWMVCNKRAAFTAVRTIIDSRLGHVLHEASRSSVQENGTLLMLRDLDAVLVRSGAALALSSSTRGVLVVDSLAHTQCLGHSAGRAAAVLHRLSEIYALQNGSAWGSQLPPRFIVLMRPTSRIDVDHLHGRLRLRDPRQLVFAAGRIRWSKAGFSRIDGAPFNITAVQQLERGYRDAASRVAYLRQVLQQRLATAAATEEGAGKTGNARNNGSDVDAEGFFELLKAARLSLQRKYQRWKRYGNALWAPWATERLAFPEIQYGVLLSSRAVEEIANAARTPLGFGRCSALAVHQALKPDGAELGEQIACAAAHVLNTDDFGIGLVPEHDPALFLATG